MKQSMNHAVTEIGPKKERRKHQEWMTDEILDMMEKRSRQEKHVERSRKQKNWRKDTI